MTEETAEESSMEVQETIENDVRKKDTTCDIIDHDVSDIINKDVDKRDTVSGGGREPPEEAADDKSTSLFKNNMSILEAEDGKNSSVLENNLSIPEAPNNNNTSVLHNDESLPEASEDKNTYVLNDNMESMPDELEDKNTSVSNDDMKSMPDASEDKNIPVLDNNIESMPIASNCKNTCVLNDSIKSMPDASDCKNTSELINKPDVSVDGKNTCALEDSIDIPYASNGKNTNTLNDNMDNTTELSNERKPSVLIDNLKNSQDASDAEDTEELKFENEEDDLDEVIQSGESFWCSLCDDGGNLLFCDGPCLRSFHAYLTEEEKEEGKDCPTLGFTEKIFKAMENQSSTWLCPNCETNRQQCFICGKLGVSAGLKKEVFNCDAAHCGQFYHLHCVGQKITRNPTKQQAYINGIKEGSDTFLCPLHRCKSCKKLEDGTEKDMQYAKCRRCPSGWHVQCLPTDILFEEAADLDIAQRAWKVPVGEGEQFRVGIYCLEHELPLEPSQMVKFPHSPLSFWRQKNRSNSQHEPKSKKQSMNIDIANSGTQFLPREQPKLSKRGAKISEPGNTIKGELTKRKTKLDAKISTASQLNISDGTPKPSIAAAALHVNATNKWSIAIAASPKLVKDIKKRVELIISKSQTLKNVEDVKQLLRTPMYYGDNFQKRIVGEGGKFIHDGKLVSILNSVSKALACLTGGDDRLAQAKCLCSMQSIVELDRVQKQMKVFLNPCLHGLRYTSFGRHFTTKPKLIEVVERLHWYIEDKDMIVDFCCGANEFSTEISKKLMNIGKEHCKYKNFDILAPKNNFQFEQKDWFTVQPHDLPVGDRLVMGLNPPFGVRAAIANPFIKHAVMFRPKLIILIVPPITKSLEAYGYELIWEDATLLKGKSFYLPGSLNTEEAILEDWNIQTPPLYLWSRSDWADKHRAIAKQNGHTTPWTLPLYQPKKERSLSPLLPPKKVSLIKKLAHKAEESIKQEFIQKPLNDHKNLKVDPPREKRISQRSHHSNENVDNGTICDGLEKEVAHVCGTKILDNRQQKHEVVSFADKIVDKNNHASILPTCNLEEKDSKKRNRVEECDNLDVPKVHRDSKLESKKSSDCIKKEPDIQLNNDGKPKCDHGRKTTEGPNGGGNSIRKDEKDTLNGPRMTNETITVDRSLDQKDKLGLESKRMDRGDKNIIVRGEVRYGKEVVEPKHQKYSTEMKRSYDHDRARRSSSNSKDGEKINYRIKTEGTRFREISERQGRSNNKAQDRKRSFENYGETSPRKKPKVDETSSNCKSYRDFLRSTLHVELPRQTSDPYTDNNNNNVSKDGHMKTTNYLCEEHIIRDSLRHRNNNSRRNYDKEFNVDDRRPTRSSQQHSRSFEEKSDHNRASRKDAWRYNIDHVDQNVNDSPKKNNNNYDNRRDSYQRQQDSSTLPKWYTMKPGGGGGGGMNNKLDSEYDVKEVNMVDMSTPLDMELPPISRSHINKFQTRSIQGVHDPSPRQRFATKMSEYNNNCERRRRSDEFDLKPTTYCDSYATKFLDFLKDPLPQDITLGTSCYTDIESPPHPDIYASQFSNYNENQYPHVEPCWKSSSILDMHHQPHDLFPSTQLNFNVGTPYGCLDNVYSTSYHMDTLPHSRVDEQFYPTDQRFMHASDGNFNGMSLVGPQMSQCLTQNGILSRPILPHPYPCGDYSRTGNPSILSSEPLYRSLLPPMSQQDMYVSGMAPSSQPWHEPLKFPHTYAQL